MLAWLLSNTLESSFCVEALQEALARFPKPTIFNTDQGSQFTADAFTSVLRRAGITISMDGRGRCIDNVFVERVWRSLKYEEVFLHAYEDLDEARAGIGHYFEFYNHVRPHQDLGYRTPDAFSRFPRPLVGQHSDVHTGRVFISILQAHGIMQDTFGQATGGPLTELMA